MLIHLLLPCLSLVVIFGAMLLLVPFGTLFIECISAFRNDKQLTLDGLNCHPTVAILVPAHNEAAVIASTLSRLLPQLRPGDRLLVIADNCTDDTAAIARANGAIVIERWDTQHRGKGYAMGFGLRYLAADPPDVVVMVDADCLLEHSPTTPGWAIAHLAQQAYLTGHPIQATYLMVVPENPSLKDSISAMAVMIKNRVRPLGLSRLGFPCVLTGSGMAFPWAVIRSVSLAHDKTVDDMQLTIDLALAGYMTGYCPGVRLTGRLMENQAARSQRSRWEHGHLDVMLTQVPRLLSAALRQRRIDLALLALDLSVLPLSLLGMVWAIASSLALGLWLIGGSVLPLLLFGLQAAMLLLSILGSWLRFDRCGISLTQLLGIPLYVMWKIPVYVAFLIKPQTKWVRTERDEIAVEASQKVLTR
jgi:cellulose synthase/poly-beta-1,6-N-acetylglucosamine synthase-like glycosyltransferase